MKRSPLVYLLFCFASLAVPRLESAPRPPATDYILHKVTLSGNTNIQSEYLLDRLTLKVGEAVKREQVRFSLGVIESTYRDRGYFEVKVSSNGRTTEEGQLDIDFTISEGDLFHIGRIRISSNTIVSDDMILRGLNIRPGDLFSQSKIFDGNRELYMLGYFDTIDIAYTKPSTTTATVDIQIWVKERPTKFLKGSAGYGTQTKERFTLGYEDLNFFGNGRKLDFKATHSGFLTEPSKFRTTIVQTRLSQPYFFGTRLDAQTDVSREWDEREAYDSIQTSWRSSVGRRFGRDLTTHLQYRFQGTRLTRVSPFAVTPGFTNVTALGPSFTYDNTNDPFLPSLGWRIVSSYEEGLRIFNGDVRFHKIESREGRFDTVFGGWTFFEGVQGGIIIPDSSSDHDIIPIFERYFLGGANSVRGYNERELGPRDVTGAPLGGNAYLVGNLEMRHAIYKKLFGVIFLDAGQLYPTEPNEIWPHMRIKVLDDFRYAAGFGLRLHSPVGAIRLELGYKLNPAGATGFFDRTGLHFSIGEVF